jgi:hypothetical protein
MHRSTFFPIHETALPPADMRPCSPPPTFCAGTNHGSFSYWVDSGWQSAGVGGQSWLDDTAFRDTTIFKY